MSIKMVRNKLLVTIQLNVSYIFFFNLKVLFICNEIFIHHMPL